MKKLMTGVLLGVALFALTGAAIVGGRYLRPALFAVGASGDAYELEKNLTLTYPGASTTSATISVPGMLPTDTLTGANVQGAPSTACTGITPTTDSVAVRFTGDPGTTFTLTTQWKRKNSKYSP